MQQLKQYAKMMQTMLLNVSFFFFNCKHEMNTIGNDNKHYGNKYEMQN